MSRNQAPSDLHPARDGSEVLAPLPEPGGGFVVGKGEDVFLGAGWHERERRQPCQTPWRAVAPRADFRLRLVPGASSSLKVLLAAPVPLLGRPYRGALYLDEQRLGEIVLKNDNWALRRFRLPATDKPRTGDFSLRSDCWFVPAERIEGSRDCRTISCYIGAVIQEGPESTDS